MPQYAYIHIQYARPTFITEVLSLSFHLSKAAFNDCYSELTLYTVLVTLIGLVPTMRINAKATPINNNNYSWHITAVELV